MSVAAQRGIDVPGELSVVGFDDVPLAAHMNPPLTTVRQDVLSWGRAAAAALLSLIEEREVACTGLPPPQLVLRATTAPPRARPADRIRRRSQDSRSSTQRASIGPQPEEEPCTRDLPDSPRSLRRCRSQPPHAAAPVFEPTRRHRAGPAPASAPASRRPRKSRSASPRGRARTRPKSSRSSSSTRSTPARPSSRSSMRPAPADYYTKIQTALAGGTGADFLWLSQEYVAGYASRGALLDLTDAVADDRCPDREGRRLLPGRHEHALVPGQGLRTAVDQPAGRPLLQPQAVRRRRHRLSRRHVGLGDVLPTRPRR